MGVDFRDIDGTVPKHFLYVADVHVRFQQAGGEGVSEHMGRDVQINRSDAYLLIILRTAWSDNGRPD